MVVSGTVQSAPFTGTVKYNSAGVQQWAAVSGYYGWSPSLAVDDSDNVVVSGYRYYSDASYVTSKYGSNGQVRWTAVYDLPSSEDKARSVVTDHSGNIYVSGMSNSDIATIKYDGGGTQQWVSRYDGSVPYHGNHWIVATAGTHGSISPGGFVRVADGANKKFTIRPDSIQGIRYAIDSVVVDGQFVGRDSTYRFTDVRTDHTIRAVFVIHHIIATTGLGGTIFPNGFVLVPDGTNKSFIIRPEVENITYMIDSVLVDEQFVGRDSLYTFINITTDHRIRAVFRLDSSHFRYRSFTYEDLIVKRPVKIKPVSDYWEFIIENTTPATVNEINIQFKNDVQLVLSAGSLTSTGSGKNWKLSGPLGAGESVVLSGRSKKPKLQSITKLWLGTRTGASRSGISPSRWFPILATPNVANIREDLFSRDFSIATNGIVIGIPRPDAPNLYGWVRLKKSKDMYKSLTDRFLTHERIDFGLGKAANEQQSFSPAKHNNRAFADLLALKVNIELSASGFTTAGFGELRFVEAGNPYSGMLLRDLASRADSMMTFKVGDTAKYRKLDNTIKKINAAFSDSIKTTRNDYAGYVLRGTKSVGEISFLRPSGAILSTRQFVDDRSKIPNIPAVMKLYQNYPNPFNPSTVISYSLSAPSLVTLKVYNTLGQEVTELLHNELMDEGEQEVEFDASSLSSGVYYYTIVAQDVEGSSILFSNTKKMLLMK